MTTYDWVRDRDTPAGGACMWMFGMYIFAAVGVMAGLGADTLERAQVVFYMLTVPVVIGTGVPLAIFGCTYGLPRRCCGWVRESTPPAAPPS